MSDEKFADFVNALSKASKSHAVTSVGTDLKLSSHVPYGIPTRIPQLDLSLGRPGYPVGRIMEFYGFEASGKTTAALHALASCQAMGGLAHFIDAEKCWDPIRARDCGVDPDKTMLTECDTMEAIFRTIDSTLDVADKLAWDKPITIVVDSVTAVTSEDELKKDIGEDARIGSDAKIIRTGLRKLCADIANRNVLVIFVNHEVAKISAVAFGRKSQAAGGHALKFWSSVRVNFAYTQQLFEGDGESKRRRGQITSLTVEKNKVWRTGRPSFKAELSEHGFDLYQGLFEALLEVGLLEKVSDRSFFFKPSETKLTRKDWKAFVDRQGGASEMYKWFLDGAQKKGLIIPYGLISKPVVLPEEEKEDD